MIVYELLTGSLPFGTVVCDDSVERNGPRIAPAAGPGPPPIRQRNPQVDKRLARLIESCLAVEPERRPQGAAELAAALRKELSLPRRVRRWAITHRWRVAAAAAGLAAISWPEPLLALRPPYSVRQFRSGLAYYDGGQG